MNIWSIGSGLLEVTVILRGEVVRVIWQELGFGEVGYNQCSVVLCSVEPEDTEDLNPIKIKIAYTKECSTVPYSLISLCEYLNVSQSSAMTSIA